MDPDDARAITDYLSKGIYPLGLNRDDKRSLRQKATSFVLSDGRLYHRGKEGRKQLVICCIEEKQQIIHTMHTEPGSRGGHNGMNTTIRKISEHYWWRRLVEDVRLFCKSCNVCSQLSVTNQRPTLTTQTNEWPEELYSYNEPTFTSAPVIEYKEMQSSSYSSDLLRSLSALYEQKICCDVVLLAGRFQMEAHKVVLIASSGFFKSLLLDKDLPFNDVITLSNISGPCLESLVSFLYSGILRLNKDNVQPTLEAAANLDITSAIELCQRFLQQECDNSPSTELAPPEMASFDQKPIVKSDDDHAELELFIETEKVPSVLNKEESGATRKIVCTEDLSSNGLVSHKKFEPKTKASTTPSNSRKRKASSALLTDADDNFVIKKPRGRPRKEMETPVTTPVQTAERRYATRSSTGVIVSRRRSGNQSEVFPLPERRSRVEFKSADSSQENLNENISSNTSTDSTVCERKPLISSDNDLQCKICSANFNLYTALKLHYTEAHRYVSSGERSYWSAHQMVVTARRRANDCGIRKMVGSDDSRRSIYECVNCSVNFALMSEALSHHVTHHSFSYVCRVPGCYKRFRTLFRRTRHQRLKHLALQSKPATLSSPKRVSLTQNGMSAVVSSSRNTDGGDGFSISNKCGWCGQTFATRAQLREHRQTVHRKPKLPETDTKKRRVQRSWNCREKGCDQIFKTKDKLRAHMSEVHPSVSYSCPDCRFKTPVEQILLRHLVRRHRERHMCQLCGKAYHKPFLLRVHLFNRHKLSDPQLKLYRCQYEGCDYACPSKNGLSLHLLKHTSGSQFACSNCSKTFKRAMGLAKHISKIHLGIRPYICDKCGVSYGDESELKIHMARHAENKPYSCTHCDYSTFQKGSLKSHLFCRHQVLMDQEMPVMKCDQCNFKTDKKCRFQDHMKMHCNIRDIPCGECGKMFVTKKTLRQHIIKVHRQKQLTCSFCTFATSVQSKLQEHVRAYHAHQELNVVYGDPSQQQILSPDAIHLQHQQQQQQLPPQQCVNRIIPATMHPAPEYQTLMPVANGPHLEVSTESSIVVGIPMTLDASGYCFQTLDRGHLVI